MQLSQVRYITICCKQEKCKTHFSETMSMRYEICVNLTMSTKRHFT